MNELWQAQWDAPRPFVHPLRTPAGAVLTVDAPDDHPWHHGLWSTIKYVNGENFWEEYDEFGLLHTTSVEQLVGEVGACETATIEWRRPVGGAVVIDELRTLRHVVSGPDDYAIDWTVELTPRADVVLDRTPFDTWGGYGGLTLRGAPDWVDTSLVVSDDAQPRDRLLGERARWCHLEGVAPIDASSSIAGVAILDHPDNPRHPTPWYASTRADTYGEGWANFCNAAFLWDDPLEVAAGVTLTMRHRVIVHDDVWPADRVERAWSEWASS
jgi:hypothetical protein